MPGAYPKILEHYFSRLAISKNKFKLRVNSNQTAGLSDIITVDLPAALVNLDTLAFHLTAAIDNPNGNGNLYSAFPSKHVESLIENIAVESSGYMVDPGPGQMLNHLYNILIDYTIGDYEKQPMRNVLSNHYTGDEFTAYTGFEDQKLVCTNFLGWVGSVQPRVQDLTLANIRLHIKLANRKAFVFKVQADTDPEWIVGQTANPDVVDISFKDMYFTVDTMEILDDNTYYNSLKQKISETGAIECPFHRYYAFPSTAVDMNDTQVFNLSTQSLDWLCGVFQHPQSKLYNDDLVTDKSTLFTRGVNTTQGNWLANSQWSVQNVSYPTFPADPEEMFLQTTQSLGTQNDTLGGSAVYLNGIDKYVEHGFAHIVRFDIGGDPDYRGISGISTLGNLGSMTWQSWGSMGDGTPGKPTKVVFAQTTGLYRVGAFKQVSCVW